MRHRLPRTRVGNKTHAEGEPTQKGRKRKENIWNGGKIWNACKKPTKKEEEAKKGISAFKILLKSRGEKTHTP